MLRYQGCILDFNFLVCRKDAHFRDISLSMSRDTEKLEPKSFSSYQAIGFSYRNNNEDSSDQRNSESNDSVFRPPFAVPKDLLNNLPCTEKLHQIMARTAIFVSEHGGQSEIVLRVKQGGNPTFGFLMPDNQLHPYFRFLVKHPQLLKHDNTLEKKNSDNGGALSLLGSMYGTGEDDENANTGDLKDESKNRGKEEPPFEKEPTVQHAVTSSKEKIVVSKKSHLIASSSTSRKKDGTAAKVGIKTDAKPVILEPPTFLKRNIDKAVEFIQKNGRKFEAKLIEQDKTIGRFPFLLASNQYHSYYLKVLEEALESKCSDSNIKRKSEEIGRDETVPDELVDDLPFNPHKKEKFTMLLGNNTRREIVDQPSKPVQQSGVTADEAAMIVLAATRGQSPFPSTSTNGSDSKNLSLNKEKTREVNSDEANLLEAGMTKEQKIKAERLKRAKLFAAMIKSGAQPIPSESKVEESNHAPVNEPKHEEVNAAEPKLEEFDEASVKERNYRKKSIDKEEEEDSDKHSTKKLHSEDKESKHRHRHSHRRHKHHYSEDEDEHSKNHRRRRHGHRKHGDSDSEEEDSCKESRHRRRSHRKYSESEDEDKHEKSSRRRRRHGKHDLSEDENEDRSRKHRRKHHRSALEKEDLEEGELCDVANAASVKSSDLTAATEVPSDLRAKIRAMLLETL